MSETTTVNRFFGLKLTNRQKMTVRIAVAFVVLVAVGWGSSRLIGDRQVTQPKQGLSPVAKRLPALRVEKQESWERTIEFTGKVRAKRQTMVGFQRAGMVVQLLVDDGDEVAERQLLANLDNRHLTAQMMSLTARLEQAKSLLKELQRGPREEKIAAGRSVVNDLQQQHNAQELRTRRSEKLVQSKAIAQQDYEQEVYRLRGLRAKLNSSQSQLDELLAGTRSEKVAAQEAAVRGIEAEIQSTRHDLEDCDLKAPFAGMIVSRKIDEGAVISQGTPVFDLIENQNLEVHVGLPDRMARNVSIGDRRSLTIGGNQMVGVVRSILSIVEDKTRTQKVILDLEKSLTAQNAVAGQVARVEFTERIDEAGFWIPATAITSARRGLWSCYVLSGDSDDPSTGKTVKQSLEVIYRDGERVFVRGTMLDGQILVSDGVHRIVAGEQLTVNLLNDASFHESMEHTAVLRGRNQ